MVAQTKSYNLNLASSENLVSVLIIQNTWSQKESAAQSQAAWIVAQLEIIAVSELAWQSRKW